MSDEQSKTTVPASDSGNKVESSASDSKKTEVASLPQELAKRWLHTVAWLINFIIPTTVSILFGFSPLPQSVPLVSVVQQHPLGSLIMCGVLAVFTVFALLFTYKPKLGTAMKFQGQITGTSRPLVVVTILSTVSAILCLSLLLVVLLRPSWCPNALCPPPQLVLEPNGVHDANLELYPVAIDSASFAIPGDPASYSANNIPNNIGADHPHTTPPFSYHVVLGVHSLQQGRFGIVIEQVALLVERTPPIPLDHPLNVWSSKSVVDYTNNSYDVIYNGQNSGAVLPARFTSIPNGFLELLPGEPYEFNLQVGSRFSVDLQFGVQVQYRVINEPTKHTLTLLQPSHPYEVIFSSNWHEYRYQNGRFVPNS